MMNANIQGRRVLDTKKHFSANGEGHINKKIRTRLWLIVVRGTLKRMPGRKETCRCQTTLSDGMRVCLRTRIQAAVTIQFIDISNQAPPGGTLSRFE